MQDLKKKLINSFGSRDTEFDLVGFPIGNSSELLDVLNNHWSEEELERMEDIQMTRDELERIPLFIRNLPNLEALNLAFNKISEVGKSDLASPLLTDLDLRENPLTHFEIESSVLSKLQAIILSKHRLSEFPETIAELSNVIRVRMEKGRIEKVRFKPGGLTKLRSIDLSFNRIGSLDDSNIDALVSLERLDLSTNGLLGLPEEIGDLSKLEYLVAEGNQLEFLPKAIGNLKRLSHLNLSANLISELPIEISGCTELGLLNLNSNMLTSLPESIGNMKELGLLYLEENQFVDIPDVLSKLPELGELKLSGNPIGSVASWVYDYSGLHLFLCECPINLEQIEESLVGMKKAKNVTVYLSGCPVESQKDQLPEIPGLTFSFEPMD